MSRPRKLAPNFSLKLLVKPVFIAPISASASRVNWTFVIRRAVVVVAAAVALAVVAAVVAGAAVVVVAGVGAGVVVSGLVKETPVGDSVVLVHAVLA